MRNFVRLIAFGAVTLVSATHAAPQNPELAAHVGEGDDATEKSKALAISKLDLDIDVRGDTARTTLTASFENSGSAALEGNFAFDLPPGSVVTGYALDIDGRMVDGVLAAKRQAKLVYEKSVRRGVDPGLAEVTRNGAFTTRVFPILPGKGRTVRLEFVAPLDPERAFEIPLVTENLVGAASIHVHLSGVDIAPKIAGPKGLSLSWTHGKDGYDAQATASRRALSGALSIAAMAPRPLTLTRHKSGDAFFEIDDAVAPAGAGTNAGSVRIYWDASRSRRDDDLKPEIALAARYVDAVHPSSVELVLFADGEPVMSTLRSPTGADVGAALAKVEYRGATSQAPLLKAGRPAAEACLLFSDGNMTLGPWRPEPMACALFAISNAADADRGFLNALAQRSGGAFVDLRAQSVDTALAILSSRAPRVVAVRDGAGRALETETLAANGNRFRLVGRLPDDGDIIVTLSQAAQATRRYTVDRSAIAPDDTLAALWASAHDRTLNATDRPDRDAMLAFERRYSVSGAASDFVVFETLQDYIDAKVEPPESFGRDAASQYRLLSKADAANKHAAEEARLQKIVGLWDEQKAWWKKDFAAHPAHKVRRTKTGETISDSADDTGGRVLLDIDAYSSPPVTAVNPGQLPPPPPPPPPAHADSGSQVETVVTTGSRIPEVGAYSSSPVTGTSQQELKYESTANVQTLLNNLPASQPAGPAIETTMADWNPDRPYLKALDAAGSDKFWEVYRAQEKEHGKVPAFYLDVGEYLYRHGKARDAAEVARNALDLPSADTQTFTILADRLMRYGDTEHALWLYERIDTLEPDRPQPKRNLALALIARAEHESADAARADYARALQLLADVVMHDWDLKYDGVEVISLMEANHIVPRLRSLGVKDATLDPRLVALLDADLRVVLEWNTDETDMDLWVDEPSGERAIYSHPKTAIGGRLSNDMTNGYGPEEYLLHKAPSGAYTVRVNVYRTDRINPNGPTTVRAHIFRNYGRADEEQQDLELELKRGDNGAQLVGVVTVARKK